MNLLFNVIGNSGTLCFLYAYYMLQRKKFAPDSYSYLGLNLAGSILLVISLLRDWNLAAFILEATWGIISSYGLWRALRAKQVSP